jgi:hypothetical protein
MTNKKDGQKQQRISFGDDNKKATAIPAHSTSLRVRNGKKEP